MNRMQVEGIVRAVMLGVSGVLVTLGVQTATGPGWESLTGLIVGLAGTLWSYHSNKTSTMISAVAKAEAKP